MKLFIVLMEQRSSLHRDIDFFYHVAHAVITIIWLDQKVGREQDELKR
jgi:hypothetical protein